MEVADFHPVVKTSVLYFSDPKRSMQSIADELGVSKQAVNKKIIAGKAFFKSFPLLNQSPLLNNELETLKAENKRLKEIIAKLRRLLIIKSSILFIANCLIEQIKVFFPKLKLNRFQAYQKKYLLDMMGKFQRCQGKAKDFAEAIGKSYDTLHRWQIAYDRFGMAGLVDKITRPKHFSCKIPKWLKDQLVLLFLRFPQWSEYQYYKYMKLNPAIQYSVSLPTIKKIKDIHTEKTRAEKERIKKLWAFQKSFDVWTIDFTTIIKTDSYKLQLLTVSDQRSRFWFDSALFLATSTQLVMDHLEELFLKYGKPFMIKVDNGPEFRIDCRERLSEFSVYLLNNPPYYGQFNGAHERIHRELKQYISDFKSHKNITRLVEEIKKFTEDHNHYWTYEGLNRKTPAEIFYSDPEFVPKECEVIEPYIKEGELRMKFRDRLNNPARLSLAAL